MAKILIVTTLFYKSPHFLVKFPQRILPRIPVKRLPPRRPVWYTGVQTVLFFQSIHLKFTAFSNSCFRIELYIEL